MLVLEGCLRQVQKCMTRPAPHICSAPYTCLYVAVLPHLAWTDQADWVKVRSLQCCIGKHGGHDVLYAQVLWNWGGQVAKGNGYDVLLA